MTNHIQTSDIYEAVYYLICGKNTSLSSIEGATVNGEINCKLIIEGEDLPELQSKYFRGEAEINLFKFRRGYAQVINWLSEAKKKIKKKLAIKAADNGGAL
jgi:hypothetical protein